MTRALGLDISKWDLTYNPAAALLQADFVIQRVGYGGYWGTQNKDEKFDAFLPGVLTIPVRGGYWYLSSHSNWKKQADFYLAQVAGIDYHFHAVDFESAYNDLSVDFGAACIEWARYVRIVTGRPVLLYANRSQYDDYLAPDYRAEDFPLWISSPVKGADPHTAPPPMPEKRDDWIVWQYIWSVPDAKLWGVGRPNSIDLNAYNGTVAEMRAWLGLDAVTPPPQVLTLEERIARLEKLHGL